MKVFIGDEPSVPLAVASKALDAMQAGHAKDSHVTAAKHALKQESCSSTCLNLAMHDCSLSKTQYATCMQQAKSQCAQSCASVGGSQSTESTQKASPKKTM